MTITIALNVTQLQSIQTQNRDVRDRIGRATKKVLAPARDLIYFAAFDGTNNDKADLRNERQCTNVGQLWDQYSESMGGSRTNLLGNYYAGLGTRGRPTRETWLPDAVTAQVRQVAQQAYDDLKAQASGWLGTHPDGSVKVVLAAFSRGAASAAAFAQLLCRNGLPGGTAPRTVDVAAGVLFDPVASGVEGNLAFPPGARNIVCIRALNEYRQLFRAVDYRRQPDVVTTFDMYGNHCDVGGGYDNGLAAITLDAATAFLRSAGLPLAKVPAHRAFDRTQLAVHSEEYDEHGNRIWDVTNEDGFSFAGGRLDDGSVAVIPASEPDAAGSSRFTLFDGTEFGV
jgi:hypothetical protein